MLNYTQKVEDTKVKNENENKNDKKNEIETRQFTHEVVIYDNQINASLKGLDKKDYDIFMACAYKLKDVKNSIVEVSYAELRKLAKVRHCTLDELHKYLKSETSVPGVSIQVEDTSGNFDSIPLFSKFSGNRQKKKLTLKVNDEFTNFFSGLTANFTQLDLAIYTGLKSKYSKILYQNLCQFRNKKTRSGFWYIPLYDDPLDENKCGFKSLFNTPEKYTAREIVRDIIKPSIEELQPYMEIDLIIEYEKARGKPVKGFRFNFKETKLIFLEQKKEVKKEESSKKKKEEFEGQLSFEDYYVKDGVAVPITENSDHDTSRIMCEYIKKMFPAASDSAIKSAVTEVVGSGKDMDFIKEFCEYTITQDVENISGYIRAVLPKWEPPKTNKAVKKSKTLNYNNYQQREYSKEEMSSLEKYLLKKGGK